MIEVKKNISSSEISKLLMNIKSKSMNKLVEIKLPVAIHEINAGGTYSAPQAPDPLASFKGAVSHQGGEGRGEKEGREGK